MLGMTTKTTETALGAVVQLPDQAGASAPDWIQLLPLGTITPRDGRAPWHLANPADVIAASLAAARGLDMPIDYDHQIDLAAVPGVGGKAPAAGWIKQLEARADGIWGRVEWTPAAAQAIAAKEYRFISPVFDFTKSDRRILLFRHAALTNNPAMTLTALSHQQQQEDRVDPILKALLEAMGLKPETDQATAVAHVQKLVAADKVTTAIAAKLGVKDTTETALAAAIDEAAKPGNPDPAKFVPIASVTALQTELAAIRKDLTADKAVTAVAAAMEAGKVSPSLKDWATDYAAKDLAGFKAWVEKAPVIAAGGVPGRPAPSADGDLTSEDRALCAQLRISHADFKKTRQAELGAQAEG